MSLGWKGEFAGGEIFAVLGEDHRRRLRRWFGMRDVGLMLRSSSWCAAEMWRRACC